MSRAEAEVRERSGSTSRICLAESKCVKVLRRRIERSEDVVEAGSDSIVEVVASFTSFVSFDSDLVLLLLRDPEDLSDLDDDLDDFVDMAELEAGLIGPDSWESVLEDLRMRTEGVEEECGNAGCARSDEPVKR